MRDYNRDLGLDRRDDLTPLADAALLIAIGVVMGLCLAIWAVLPLLKPGVLL